MNNYIIMPEGTKWSEEAAADPKTAYSLVCSWYKPSTKVAIMDKATGKTVIFTRKLDSAGNLIEVIEHHELTAH